MSQFGLPPKQYLHATYGQSTIYTELISSITPSSTMTYLSLTIRPKPFKVLHISTPFLPFLTKRITRILHLSQLSHILFANSRLTIDPHTFFTPDFEQQVHQHNIRFTTIPPFCMNMVHYLRLLIENVKGRLDTGLEYTEEDFVQKTLTTCAHVAVLLETPER